MSLFSNLLVWKIVSMYIHVQITESSLFHLHFESRMKSNDGGFWLLTSLGHSTYCIVPGGGGDILPYTPIYFIGYTGMCHWRRYGFQAIWSGKGYGFQTICSGKGYGFQAIWSGIYIGSSNHRK